MFRQILPEQHRTLPVVSLLLSQRPRLEKKSKSTTVARNGRLLGHKNADIDRIMSVALRQQSSDFISEAHSARTAGCDSGGV